MKPHIYEATVRKPIAWDALVCLAVVRDSPNLELASRILFTHLQGCEAGGSAFRSLLVVMPGGH